MIEKSSRWLGAGGVLLLAVLAAPAPARSAARPGDDEEIRAQIERAMKAVGQKDFRTALDAYKKADRMAGGRSGAALDGMAAIYGRTGRIDDSIKAARRGVQAANTPELQSRLENRLGVGLYQKYKAGDDKKALDEAIASFRKALDLSGGQSNAVRFNLGMALLSQSRDEEGVALLKAFLERPPDGADPEQARRMIADPRRAREAFAPDFSAVTLDGRAVSLDDLKGKVVLIDFWATWCAPCRQSSPSLKRLAEKLKQEPFVLLGISDDRDGAKLRDYVAREAEAWPQIWDQAGNLQRVFGVGALPTFVVLDGEGRIVHSMRGWSLSGERELTSAVSRAFDRLRSSAPAKEGKT